MMRLPQFIKHRVNESASLADLPKTWGVEIDLRSSVHIPQRLHLAHDPWKVGEEFEEWLRIYKQLGLRGPLILNTKEDGLEETIKQLLGRCGINHYFFLDTALPTLVKRVQQGEGATQAVRFSSYESWQGCPFVGKVRWAWVDCFGGKPLAKDVVAEIAKHFEVCLVSPELQSEPLDTIKDFTDLIPFSTAICTKSPESWLRSL